MSIIFFGSWFAQSVTGWTTYNADQVDHHQATVSWLGYVGSADFWEATLENWQSEFLAVGSFVAHHGLPAPARLDPVEAGGRPPRRHRRRGLAPPLRRAGLHDLGLGSASRRPCALRRAASRARRL